MGAVRETKELVKNLDREKIKGTTSNRGISWQFNPPRAPHFIGVFESMIKAAKRVTYGVLGQADANDEETQTVFAGDENSRHLTTVSGEVDDEVALTPNHFLIGHMGGELVPETVDMTTATLYKRWRRVQELIRRVWHRQLREYLPLIGSRNTEMVPAKREF